MPAGKVESGETPRNAVIREVFEEVGLNIDADDLEEIGKLYMRLPDTDYVFHRFRKRFDMKPNIILELSEHQEARWVTISEALKLPLIVGAVEALLLYKDFIDKKGILSVGED